MRLRVYSVKRKMKKDFDSVKMMRDIRDRLHRMYEKDPELRQKNLERIRKKYGIKKQISD